MSTHRIHLGNALSAQLLKEMAVNPFDMRDDSLLSGARLERYVCTSGPYRLIYSTQRVTDDVLDRLQDLADECRLVQQFREMRQGAVINRIEGYPSEERQVLHTACRDLFSQNPKQPEASAQAKEELAKLRIFLDELESGLLVNEQGERFTTLVNVGIGGSDLGPRSVYEALKPYGIRGRSVRFIANVDPDDAAGVLEGLDLSTTLVNIVSKSGTTLETLTNEQLVVERLKAQGLEPARHCIAVTGKGSPMDNPARYLRSFYMFDYIGGRFSTCSMVGSVMLGFYLGYDQLESFLKGASIIDDAAENVNIRKNLPLLLALIGVWNHNFLGNGTVAILPYSQALHRFPAHLQQCDMESNGKSVNRQGDKVEYLTGPVVWGEPGTNGQHAFYQLLHQGTECVPVEFIGFLENQSGKDIQIEGTTSQQKLLANLLAQSIALATGKHDVNPNKQFAGNRPSSVLLADRLDPYSMGALLAIYEAKIAFQGFIWNINSFDQEGVQLGKMLANKLLERMSGKQLASDDDIESLETRFLNAALGSVNSTIQR